MKDIGLVGRAVQREVHAVHGAHARRRGRRPVEPGRRAGAGSTAPGLTEMERSREDRRRAGALRRRAGRDLSAQGIAKLREADALAVVVRCFGGDATPAAELGDVHAELLLADLAVIDSALERAEKRAKGKPLARGRRPRAGARGAVGRDAAARREARGRRPRAPPGDRAAHAEAVGGGGEPRGGDRGAGRAAGGRGRRVRLDRGRDRRDGPRGGARAAGGVRRRRAGPRPRDRARAIRPSTSSRSSRPARTRPGRGRCAAARRPPRPPA